MFYSHIFIMAVPLFFGLLRADFLHHQQHPKKAIYGGNIRFLDATLVNGAYISRFHLRTSGSELSSTDVAAHSTASYSDYMSSLSKSPTSEAPATTTTSVVENDSTASAGTIFIAPTLSIRPDLSSIDIAAQSTASYFDNISSLSISPTSKATSVPENDSTASAGTIFIAPTSSIRPELSSTNVAAQSTASYFDNMSLLSITPTSEVPATTITSVPGNDSTASAGTLSTAPTPSIRPELSSTYVAAQSTASYFDDMSLLSITPTSEAPATTITSVLGNDSTASAGTLSTATTPSIQAPATTITSVPENDSTASAGTLSTARTPSIRPELSSTYVAAQSTASYFDNMSLLSITPTSEAPAKTTTSVPENDSTASADTFSTAPTPSIRPELSSTYVAAQSTASYFDNMSLLSITPTSEAPPTTTTSVPGNDLTASAGTLSTAPTPSIRPELSSTDVAAQSTASYFDNMSLLSITPTSEAPATTITSVPGNDLTVSAGTLSTASTPSIHCQGLSNITNGQGYFNDTIYEANATYTCDTGYVINATNETSLSVTCTENGTWSDDPPTCVKRDCQGLSNITNGQIDFNDTTYEANATYTCDTGHVINATNETSLSITCTENGTWSDDPPTCVKRDCHAPENISNGKAEIVSETNYGSSAVYKCNKGFEFNASLVNQTVSCTEGGEWESLVLNCTDIDECTRNLDDCHFWANCSNNDGGFSCKCREGFKDKFYLSHGKECVDIDECEHPDTCCSSGTRHCLNVIGQYFCLCKQGYKGERCEKEIDECKDRDSCGVNAICTNTLGSYFCRCNDTYPSGNPYIHCYENTIIHFEPHVDPVRGNTVKMTSHAVPFRYTYFGVQHYVFRAAMDGFISLGFQQVFDRYAPANSSEWVKSSHFNSAYDPASIIAPLWSDLDTTNITNAGLYVHYFSADETGNVTDSNAKKAFGIAKKAFNSFIKDSSFEPKVLLEATWANVTVAFQALPAQKFVKRENATMQAILVSNGISTYIMFNYAQDEWNIKSGHRRFGVAGYSNPDFTGNVIADRNNFMDLSNTSTNSDLKGRHIFDVTNGSVDQMAFLQVEEDCRSFYKNESVWNCTARQNKKAYVCPCQEDFVKYDLSLHKVEINATLGHGVDYPDKTACYQEWFFNFGGVKQTCCYQFGTISTSQYAGGFALFKDDKCGADVGYQKCCVESKRLCHLFYKMNPPNNCTGYEFPSFIG